MIGLVGDRQAIRVGADHLALSAPVTEQVAHQVLDRAGPERVERLDPCVEFGGRLFAAEHRRPPRHVGRTLRHQPVAQGPGGAYVVLVVGGDHGEAGLVARTHPALVLDDGAGALVDLVAALVVGEPLDVLEAVALHADLHRPLHDRQEIDELARGDQLFECEFGDAVLGDQPFERRSFGVVVVVHVHVGELLPAGGEMVDECLRGNRFFFFRVRPERLELPLAGG